MDIVATSVLELLKEPLNQAHVEDRRALKYLQQDDPDYQSAVECHQRAHAHLRTVLLRFSPEDLHKAAYVDEVFLRSLYSQMEYHIQQQTILLNKQKRAIIEIKRQPYIASIREKTTELALLDAVSHKAKLEAQLSQQSSLLQSLKGKLTQEEEEGCDILNQQNSDRSSKVGWKKPKDSKETLEELHNLNEQFKNLVDELVNENLKLRSELASAQRLNIHENTFTNSQEINDDQTTDQMIASHNSTDNPIYPLPRALNLVPLEEPPEFDIPEELQELVTSEMDS